MQLIDRILERDRLRRAAAEAPQLVVLRGRRRVGKSYLINVALQSERLVFFQADEQDERGHLSLVGREAAALLPGNPPLAFGSWDDALGFFGSQAGVQPLVVALDEFQWLWDAQPALDSMIQRHWDRWQRTRTPICLILSGSSLLHMERLLEPDRPLYGRADYRPLLLPLDYRLAAGFTPEIGDPELLLRRYAVLGGTPQYQVWAGGGPIQEVIADRILRQGESLYEEPLHLLREEHSIRTPGTYFQVVYAIARGRTQFNALAQHANVEPAQLAKMLTRLTDLGYVEVREPLEHSGPARRRGLYRLRDPFFRFWFRYVFPNRSRLERGRVTEVLDGVVADFDNYMGTAFEDCCREWAGRYAPDLAGSREIGAWWDRKGSTEIDIVGTDKHRYDLVASCKWDAHASPNVLGELERDAGVLGARAADAKRVVFARGFDDELVRRAGDEDVRLVSAADLFA